jgi:hypothetical protein
MAVTTFARYIIGLRRFLAASGLALWQGGFTFYGAVVIPMGVEVLRDHVQVGFITQRVTQWLNLIGAAALVLLLVELAANWPSLGSWRKFGLASTWLAMALGLVALFALHPALDALLEPNSQNIVDYDRFLFLHRVYLGISTIQWSAALLHAWCLLLPAAIAHSNVEMADVS